LTAGRKVSFSGPKGTGQKASDYTFVPLTRVEHEEYDSGREAFERRHGISMSAIVRDLNRTWFAYSEGYEAQAGRFVGEGCVSMPL
jgi:hypothetical protein